MSGLTTAARSTHGLNRRRPRWFVLAAAMLAFPLPAVARQAPAPDLPRLTLSAALDLADRQNRSTGASRLDVAAADDRVAEARALRLPQFDVDVRAAMALRPIDFIIPAGAIGTFAATGPIPAHAATIQTPQQLTGVITASVAQPLSQWHTISLGIDESTTNRALAAESVRGSREDTALEVRTAYYRVAQLQAQLTAVTDAVRALTELSALTDRQLSQETILKSDSLRAAASLAQARYQALTIADAVDTQKESLNDLLGRDPATPFSVDPLDAPLPDVAATDAITSALADRPDVRSSHLRVMTANLESRRARAAFWPDVTAELSYFSFPNVSFVPQNVFTAGVTVSWQPFDWGQRRRKVAEADVALEQALLASAETEAQVSIDVRAKERALAEARALLAARDAGRDAAREALRVAHDRYDQQASLLADLLQQESAVTQAEGDYQQALAGWWMARATLDRALGRMPQ